MKFMKQLQKLDPNEMVYVGTDKGSNWICIATSEELINKIEELEKYFKDYTLARIKSASSVLDKKPYELVDCMNMYKNMENKTADQRKKLSEMREKIEKLQANISSAHVSKKKYEKELNGWKHVSDREVVETYQKETYGKGTCIIIKGIVDGNMWSLDNKNIVFK